MFVITHNDVPIAAAFTKKAAIQEVNAQRLLNIDDWLESGGVPETYDFHNKFKWTEVKLVTKLGVHTPEIPNTNEKLQSFRRETSGKFSTIVAPTGVDYAEGLQDVTKALSHLSEAIPNGQLYRTRAGFKTLVEGTKKLATWLDTRNVFFDGDKDEQHD